MPFEYPKNNSVSKDSISLIRATIKVAKIAGVRIGKVIRLRVVNRLAPEIREASSKAASIPRKAGVIRINAIDAQ